MRLHIILATVSILRGGVDAQVESNPCVICPDGATAGDDFAPFADFGDPTTCGYMIDSTKQIENGTESCALREVAAIGCCPTAIDDPCILCPDGATAGDDFVAYEINGINQTCGELIETYKLFESNSGYCQQLGEYDKAQCCPAPVEDPCIICPNGTTVPDNFIPYVDIGNCAQLIDFVKLFESTSDVCAPESDEAKCCPPPAEDPCIICPNGATAADDFIPYADIGNCVQLIDALKLYESSDSFCTPEIDEAMCCPTVSEDPCIICPNGATVAEDFLPYAMLGINETCKELIDLAKNFETGSDYCAEVELDESFCCPTEAENPCAICPGGITVTEYAFSSFGGFSMPCDVLIEHLAHFPLESDLCFEFGPVYAEACCSTETGDVPIFIPVEETTTAATTAAVSEETDTEVSVGVTTTSSTLGELAELDLEDLNVTTPPASSSSSFFVSRLAVFVSVPIAYVLRIIALV